MKKIIYIILLIVLMNIVSAQGIEVVKEVPQEINLNSITEIKIHISNPYPKERKFLVEEIFPQDIEIIEPEKFSIKKTDALEIKYYQWSTTISADSIKTITYKIKPLSPGEYFIGSTEITDKSTHEIYYSNPITFKVECTPNGICEKDENSLTCPKDCPQSGFDGICDYLADGICDLDCDSEPDCKRSKFDIRYITIPFIIIIIILITLWIISKIRKKNKYKTINEKTKSL